jgi:hypothetical protein
LLGGRGGENFRNYLQLLKLEAKHGVNLGASYATEIAGKDFTHYIAEDVRQHLYDCFPSCLMVQQIQGIVKMNSFLLCGLTSMEVGIRCVLNRSMQACFCYCCRYARGITGCLGIHEIGAVACSKLVGFGSNGASANIAGAGLRLSRAHHTHICSCMN